MLQLSNLTAVRGEKELFQGLSFDVNPGDLIQIEGRNGSGKTTLLRLVTGLSDREQGEICWNGVEIKKDRDAFHQDMLFLGHQTGIKKELTAFENLEFYLSIHSPKHLDHDKIWQALIKVGLAGREDIPTGKLSAGQQRRVALARLWLSQQKLWILDEPLTAIDKQGIAVLEALFLQHTQAGGMILFTTHQDMFVGLDCLKKIRLGD